MEFAHEDSQFTQGTGGEGLAAARRAAERWAFPRPAFRAMRCLHCNPVLAPGEDTPRNCAIQTLGELWDPEIQAAKEFDDEQSATASNHERSLIAAGRRKWLYRLWVHYHFGELGKGERVELELCVVRAVHQHFPNPECCCPDEEKATCTKHYMGHKAAC